MMMVIIIIIYNSPEKPGRGSKIDNSDCRS